MSPPYTIKEEHKELECKEEHKELECKELEHKEENNEEENKAQFQNIIEEMDIIQQKIDNENQALAEMNDEQKQIYKEIKLLAQQMQIREARKRLIADENIYNFPEEILMRIENAHVYSEEEIEKSLDYIRDLARLNYPEDQLKEISILFEKFTINKTSALFSSLISLQLGHKCISMGAISLYMVFYTFAKIIGLYSIKNIMKLLNKSLEKVKEFKERFNVDFSEFIMLDNRRLPCLNNVLKNMKLNK